MSNDRRKISINYKDVGSDVTHRLLSIAELIEQNKSVTELVLNFLSLLGMFPQVLSDESSPCIPGRDWEWWCDIFFCY